MYMFMNIYIFTCIYIYPAVFTSARPVLADTLIINSDSIAKTLKKKNARKTRFVSHVVADMYVHVQLYIRIHTYIHIHTRIHTYTYIYTYT